MDYLIKNLLYKIIIDFAVDEFLGKLGKEEKWKTVQIDQLLNNQWNDQQPEHLDFHLQVSAADSDHLAIVLHYPPLHGLLVQELGLRTVLKYCKVLPILRSANRQWQLCSKIVTTLYQFLHSANIFRNLFVPDLLVQIPTRRPTAESELLV